MKKILLSSLCALFGASGAIAAPSYLTRVDNGGYQVTYDYTDKAKSGWYVGGRAELSFLNWTNKYSSDYSGTVEEYNSDKYSFEQMFGGNLSAGYRFLYFWRAELEAGILGQFTDKDNSTEFGLTVPYVMLNGYYDFTNNFYVGAGLGAAMPIKTLDYDNFIAGDRSKMSVSPMAGLMFGYAKELDDNLVLDIRYRLSGFYGGSQTRYFQEGTEVSPGVWEDVRDVYVENKIGLVLDNSISIGLRYEF